MDAGSIGDKIRRLRKARGLTLESLAGDQFTKGYLSLIERGKTPPSFRVIAFIAERLGCTLAELFGPGEESGLWTHVAEDFRRGRYDEVVEAAGRILTQGAMGDQQVQARLWQARAFIETRRFEQCVEVVAPLIGGDEPGPALEVEAGYMKARALLELRRFEDCVCAADRGLRKALSCGIVWPELCARLRLNRATALMGLERFADAIDAFNETLDFARAHNQPGIAADALIRSGFCHLQIGNPARALDLALTVRDVRDALGDAVQQAEARVVLAMAAIAGHDRAAALSYAQEASDLLAAHPSTPEAAEAAASLAAVLTDLGQTAPTGPCHPDPT